MRIVLLYTYLSVYSGQGSKNRNLIQHYKGKVMIIDSDDEPAALIIDESFQDNNDENNKPDGSRIESEGVESSRQKGVLHQSQCDSKTEPHNPPISKIKSFNTDEFSRENGKIPRVPSGTKIKKPISTIGPEKILKKRRKGEKGEESNSYDPPPGSSWNIEDKFLPEVRITFWV